MWRTTVVRRSPAGLLLAQLASRSTTNDRRSVGVHLRPFASMAAAQKQAKALYGTIAVATLIGAVANVLKLNPIKALVWSAVLNAMLAAAIMVPIMRIAINPSFMGQFTISRRSRALGWLATIVMGVASLGFVISLIFG